MEPITPACTEKLLDSSPVPALHVDGRCEAPAPRPFRLVAASFAAVAVMLAGCSSQSTVAGANATAAPKVTEAADAPVDEVAVGLWRYPEVMPLAIYLAPDSRAYSVGGTTGLFTKIWSDPDAVAAAMPLQAPAGTWRQDGSTVSIIGLDGSSIDARGVLHGDTIDLAVLSGEPVSEDPALQLTRMSRK